jgi:predicted permease
MRVLGFTEVYVGDLGRTLWVLLAAVGCVLLISCANAANLLLARAVAREREIVVRSALGAGRGRILRQLLLEGIALSLIAGAVGAVVGSWSLGALLSLAPSALPRGDEIGLDLRVLALTGAIVAITGIAFGLVAALPTSRLDLATSLRDRMRAGANRGRLREMLVVAETAFAIVLLAAAGLFIASFAKLRGVDPGFSAESVVAVRFGRMPRDYSTERRIAFSGGLLDRVRAIPGVEAAGGVSNFPLERGPNIPVAIAGRPNDFEGDVEWRAVTPGALDALAVPIRRGRALTEADRLGAARVALVNETFVRRFFPNEDPIGHRVEIGKWKGAWLSPAFDGAAEIVGVVADTRELALDRAPKRTVIVPAAQWPGTIGSNGLIVRTSRPSLVEREIVQIARSIDPTVGPPTMEELSAIVGASIREQRFQMVLLAVFAGSALLLTAIGVFAVLSYTVRDRAREIGVRVALGARPQRVIRLVVGRALALVGIGAAIGLVVAVIASRALAAMLFGVTPTEPSVLASAVAALLVIAVIAAWIPARRAALVDPLVALRAD